MYEVFGIIGGAVFLGILYGYKIMTMEDKLSDRIFVFILSLVIFSIFMIFTSMAEAGVIHLEIRFGATFIDVGAKLLLFFFGVAFFSAFGFSCFIFYGKYVYVVSDTGELSKERIKRLSIELEAQIQHFIEDVKKRGGRITRKTAGAIIARFYRARGRLMNAEELNEEIEKYMMLQGQLLEALEAFKIAKKYGRPEEYKAAGERVAKLSLEIGDYVLYRKFKKFLEKQTS